MQGRLTVFLRKYVHLFRVQCSLFQTITDPFVVAVLFAIAFYCTLELLSVVCGRRLWKNEEALYTYMLLQDADGG
jgi:hypothetical protein